jgi:hypothetical protein
MTTIAKEKINEIRFDFLKLKLEHKGWTIEKANPKTWDFVREYFIEKRSYAFKMKVKFENVDKQKISAICIRLHESNLKNYIVQYKQEYTLTKPFTIEECENIKTVCNGWHAKLLQQTKCDECGDGVLLTVLRTNGKMKICTNICLPEPSGLLKCKNRILMQEPITK